MRYSEQVIEQVKNSSSLSELVSERTEVRRSGSSVMACCPFHSEKTPSFHINEEEGLYYCFGCGKKGNTFTFVMETRGLSFPESVRYLAQRYGIALPIERQATQYEKGLAKRKTLLRKILFETQNLYEDILWERSSASRDGALAREILSERDIDDQTIKRFRLGFTGLKSGYLYSALRKILSESMPVNEKELLESLLSLGLLRKYNNERTSELFRDRIIFPIARSDGNPIAFGGRIIHKDSEAPKYINSPESPVYEKRRSFYGLPQAISAIQKSRTVYLVEGYTDVLSFHQAGIENAVAVCGTALTPDHCRILSRFVSRAYLIFDADGAGRTATARSFPSFLNSGIEAIPVFLPEGEDPDSMARKVFRGELEKESFNKILSEGETSLVKIYLESQAASLLGMDRGSLANLHSLRANERGKLAEQLAEHLNRVINPVERDFRIKESSSILGINENSLIQLLRQIPKSRTSQSPGNKNQLLNTSSWKNKPREDYMPDLSESPEDSGVVKKRLIEMTRQLVIAVLVDPAILKNEGVYDQSIEISRFDQRYREFFKIIASLIDSNSSSYNQIIAKGLSRTLNMCEGNTNTSVETEEVLAAFHAVFVRCGLENSGYLEEAVRQLTMGGSRYPEISGSMGEIISRITMANKVDSLRMREAESIDADEKMNLIQEKLMMKRSLEKLKSKDIS